MGRPKACEESKTFACSFALAVTAQRTDERDGNRIDCKGQYSIFALLQRCYPSVIREGTESRVNRTGVSEVEFNKLLSNMGFASCRERHRVTRQNVTRWSKGMKRWYNRRFVDPSRPSDMLHLRKQFPIPESPEASCSLEQVIQWLRVFTSKATSKATSHKTNGRRQTPAAAESGARSSDESDSTSATSCDPQSSEMCHDGSSSAVSPELSSTSELWREVDTVSFLSVPGQGASSVDRLLSGSPSVAPQPWRNSSQALASHASQPTSSAMPNLTLAGYPPMQEQEPDAELCGLY